MSVNVIGRESERSSLLAFVERCEKKGTGGVLYCAGPPGTGKTLCTQNVLTEWVRSKSCKSARRYDYLNVIGLNDHLKVFSAIETLIKGKSFVSQIRKRGRGKIEDNAEPFAMVADCIDSIIGAAGECCVKPTTCVYVLDEIDYLCPSLTSVTRGGNSKSAMIAKKQLDLVTSLFSLPQILARRRSNLTLIIIGIANSIDLSEKIVALSRPSKRLMTGTSPVGPLIDSSLLFRPYQASELKDIVNQITENDLDPVAVEICSRKVAAIHGDCRKVIDLCKQAKSIATGDHGSVKGVMSAMDSAYKSYSESVKSLPLQQLLVLVAACRHASENPNRSDFPVTDLKSSLSSLIRELNVPMIEVCQLSIMLEHVTSLVHCGLMTVKGSGSGAGSRATKSSILWRLNCPFEQLQETLKKTTSLIARAVGGNDSSDDEDKRPKLNPSICVRE
jgi:origin recognition complex subunit 1